MHQFGTDDSAPRKPYDVYFFLPKPCTQQLRQGMCVRNKAIHSQCRNRYGGIRFAGAGLVPIDDDEMLFEWRETGKRGWKAARAGPANAEIKQDRLGLVLTANRNPLLAAVSLYLFHHGNTIRQRLATRICNRGSRRKNLRDANRNQREHEQTRIQYAKRD